MPGKHGLHPNLFILCQPLLLLVLMYGFHPTVRRHSWTLFIPISALCIYSCFFCTSNSATSDYPFIRAFINPILTTTDYILLHQKMSRADMLFTERLVRASSLLSTSRGRGWAHEPTSHIPPRPTSSRGNFILAQILWVISYSTPLSSTFSKIHVTGPAGPRWWLSDGDGARRRGCSSFQYTVA